MVIFCVSGAFAYDVNKDITNICAPAWDLTVVLAGIENVTNHYDGNVVPPNQGIFNNFAVGIVGGNTQLRWWNFFDGINNVVDPQQIIHVGWTTQDHSSNVIDMYWTGPGDERLQIPPDYNITIDWTKTAPQAFIVTWNNIFAPAGWPIVPITIANVNFAVLPGAVPLALLNAQNAALAALFVPLPGGVNFVVPPFPVPGVTLPIPAVVPVGSVVVVRYDVTAPGSSCMIATDYVQFKNDPPPYIPSLSQWGLIIAAMLLLMVGAFMIWRRLKVVRT